MKRGKIGKQNFGEGWVKILGMWFLCCSQNSFCFSLFLNNLICVFTALMIHCPSLWSCQSRWATVRSRKTHLGWWPGGQVGVRGLFACGTKERGREGNWVAKGEKRRLKDVVIWNGIRKKRLAENCFSLVWMCVCFIFHRLVDWCTTQAKGLTNSLSKYLLSTQYVLGVAPSPKVVKFNRTPEFLTWKKLG